MAGSIAMPLARCLLLAAFACHTGSLDKAAGPEVGGPAPGPEPEPEASRSDSQDDPCADGPLLVDAALAMMEEVGEIAAAAAGDCHVFADRLEALVEARASFIAEMEAKAAAHKAAGCPDPGLPPDWEARAAKAMEPLSALESACADDPRYQAAMSRAFEKQVEERPEPGP